MIFARGLAFIQFIVTTLGFATLHMVVRIDDSRDYPTVIVDWASLLTHRGYWLLTVPILWAIFATMMQNQMKEKALNAIGVTLAIFLFLLFAVPLAFYLQ